AAQPARKVDFETDVRPIFARACYACHGPQKQKSDFRLDQKAAALKGGDIGVAIVPGKAGESPLFDRISTRNDRERMPPKGNPALKGAEAGRTGAWIDKGAKGPEYPAASNAPHWAYQPLKTAGAIPAPRQASSAIDAFILAKLSEKGLKPSPPAEKRVWLRR